jgi:hypothetical protein
MLVRGTALRGVNAVAATLSTGIEVRRLQATGVTFDSALHRGQPVTFVPGRCSIPSADTATMSSPAVFILLLQHTLLIGIGTLRVAERQAQGSEREPIWAVLAGKVGALTLVYLLHAALMFAVVFRVCGFPMRASWLETSVLLVPYLAAATASCSWPRWERTSARRFGPGRRSGSRQPCMARPRGSSWACGARAGPLASRERVDQWNEAPIDIGQAGAETPTAGQGARCDSDRVKPLTRVPRADTARRA